MDKTGIPTEVIKIGDREIGVYKWFTAEEDAEYNRLLMGDKEFDISEESLKKGNMKASFSFSSVAKASKYLVEHICVDLKWEEYNILSPSLRQELVDKINKVREGKKASPK